RNVSRMLGRDEVMPLLRSPEPADMVEGLLALCQQSALPEAHGLAVAVYAPLSPAAQAAPLSRAGVSERGRMALRSMGGWATRVSGEATLLIRGPGEREKLRKARSRHEQEQRAQAQLATLPEEPAYSPDRPSRPRPLDLGESLDEQAQRAREERSARLGAPAPRPASREPLPPSMFLGEGGYLPSPPLERRVDLSDTPGMAALGRASRPLGAAASPVDMTIGERVRQSFGRAFGTFTSIGRRRLLRRPPPSAMPPRRRQQGLSYRRQRPPFPFLLLGLLVSLVALL